MVGRSRPARDCCRFQGCVARYRQGLRNLEYIPADLGVYRPALPLEAQQAGPLVMVSGSPEIRMMRGKATRGLGEGMRLLMGFLLSGVSYRAGWCIMLDRVVYVAGLGVPGLEGCMPSGVRSRCGGYICQIITIIICDHSTVRAHTCADPRGTLAISPHNLTTHYYTIITRLSHTIATLTRLYYIHGSHSITHLHDRASRSTLTPHDFQLTPLPKKRHRARFN